ncbi:MAG: tetratricopeptide repeat protein [Nitrosomonadales bacterium]
MQRTPQEAIVYFSDGLGTQKYGNQIAQRYGLALALLGSGQALNAKQAFAPLQEEATQNPMLATLEGKIKQANKSKDTIEFYSNATQNFPQHHALSYDYAELLLKDKRYDDALKLLNEQIFNEDDDVRLYELQARSYAALNKPQEEHHALAYTYVLRGNLHGAIDQLELAKKAGSDYYQLSTIESELKEFREVEAAHAKQ